MAAPLNGIKLLTRLRVRFSDLGEHKFRRNFYITPMCMCSEGNETTEHLYLLRYQHFADHREILFDTVPSIIQNDVSTFQENDLCSLLLYRDMNLIILKVVSSLLVRLNLYIANQCKNVSGFSVITQLRNSPSVRILVY